MQVYADNAATTKMSQTAINAMLPYMERIYGNPSSLYSVGQEAAEALHERPGDASPSALNATPSEITFTSGGSEADNQALLAAAWLGLRKGKKHIISTAFEHHAILHTLKKLEKEGFEVQLLPMWAPWATSPPSRWRTPSGEDTCLVTIMYANNEIGSIQPIAEIGAVCQEKGVLFHTDAVQAAGHLPIDVKAQNIDMLSLSGPQVPRPQGRGRPLCPPGRAPDAASSRAAPRSGASRAGTENVPGIVGMAAALQEACEHMEDNAAHGSPPCGTGSSRGSPRSPTARLNGDPVNRLPGNVSFCFEGIEGESLLLLLDAKGICASSGSRLHLRLPGPQPRAAGHRPCPTRWPTAPCA